MTVWNSPAAFIAHPTKANPQPLHVGQKKDGVHPPRIISKVTQTQSVTLQKHKLKIKRGEKKDMFYFAVIK